jgi:AraC-like DNA-binding protein
MVLEWSTDSVPASACFALWREACCQHVYALTPERHSHGPFRGHIVHQQLGQLDVADIACDGHLVQRRAQDIREHPSDTIYIYLQRAGHVWFEQRGQRHTVAPGDIVIADPDVAFSTGTDDSFDFRLWRVARARLRARLVLGSGELPMVRIGREQAECELIALWLDSLLHHHARLAPAPLARGVDTLCDLVAHVAGAAPAHHEPVRQARRRARLQKALRVVEQRAGDMQLAPEHVARECGVSLRTLHLLFESTEQSFHEHVTQARLVRAHALLLDPTARHLSAAEIGYTAGFAEVSTFYRRFKQRYGMAPGELRTAGQSRARPSTSP